MPGAEQENHRCGTCGTTAPAGSRFCAMCGAALATLGGGAELRRNVVVLFADLAGFTAVSEGMDPEVLRAVMDRYFRLCSQLVWNFGGVTEKFIGDAIMAVFGIPVSREDDALRAVRTALEIISELESLNRELAEDYGIRLRIRIGVHAGPVSASYDTTGDFRVVGDTVNTASRLQTAAGPGELLLGEPVAQLVRSRLRLEELEPLRVKGKEAPVRAWRVLPGAPDDTSVRTVPLVGREAELTQLHHTYRRTLGRDRGCLVTVLGPPGIGKSRLVAEFLDELGPDGPLVLRGHAHSYGKGVTYRPVVELLESSAGAWAGFQLRGAGDPATAQAVAHLRGVLGGGEAVHGPEVQDISWALEHFFTVLVDRKPLVVVWEDLHWAEQTLLDVIDHLADELADLPVMHLCVARPELLEARPSWGGGRSSSITLELLPLTESETLRLVTGLASAAAPMEVAAQECDPVLARIAEACEGNPLFAELMLDVVGEDPENPTPAGVQALLAARLDRLAAPERQVLEMVAVAGREFTAVEVGTLLRQDGAPADQDPVRLLDQLRRGRLVHGRGLAEPYRFAQALVRDTAYELTAKRNRLRWHLALADQETRADQSAYHLEAAWRLSRELHPHSPDTERIAERAAAALRTQALLATDRKDLPAAVSLLERAHQVLPPRLPGHLELALRLSDAWLALRNRDRATAAVAADPGGPAEQQAEREFAVRMQRRLLDLRFGDRSEAAAETDAALDALGAGDLVRCRFHQLEAERSLMRERISAAERSLRRAEEYALALPDSYELHRVRRAAAELALWGPMPVAEGLDRCRTLAVDFADSRVSLVPVRAAEAGLLALAGRTEEAWAAHREAAESARQLRLHSAEVGICHIGGVIAGAAGDHGTARDFYERARAVLAQAGQEQGSLLLDAYATAETVALGEPVPARFAELDRSELAAIADPRTRLLVTAIRARAAVERQLPSQAEELCADAEEVTARLEDLYFLGTVHEALASVLLDAGAPEAAGRHARTAADRYTAKGALPSARRVGDWSARRLGTAPERTGGAAKEEENRS